MHHDAVQIPWQPVKTRRASEEIYLQLREFILSGQLKPGDRLPSERAMMTQLNRSRPTIREALRMLEKGGYIASTHGAPGAVVQEPSLHGVEEPLAEMIQLNQISLQELGEYSLNNDSTIAMWAAQRRSAADLQQLRQCLQEAQASLEDYEHFVDLDVKFHSLLAQATGNRVAVIVTQVLGNVEKETLRRKMLAISQADRLALEQRILMRHQIILSAIELGDAEGAREAMIEHSRAANQDLPV